MLNQVAKFWIISWILAAVLFFTDDSWARPINIGSVNTQPAAEIKKFQPFASYLAKYLQPDGIEQGKVIVAKDMKEMAVLIREGKVDVYIDSAFPALAVSRLAGSKLLVRRWKKGIGEYHTVIFTRADSGVNQINDLKGKTISFEEPYSTTGYFVPKTVLLQQGLKLVDGSDSAKPSSQNNLGYLFSRGDDATMMWVLRRKVQAGAMDNQTYVKEARENLGDLKILHKTFSIPRQVVSHRGDLPAGFVAKIKEILIEMEQSEEGKKVLLDFENTTKFDDLPEQSVTPLLRMQGYIDAELGMK